MATARPRGWTDALLNVGLGVGAMLVALLLYGLASRALTPRTTPVRAGADTLAADPALVLSTERVQVEVRNASGRDGLAAAATAHLRRRGFDVLGTGTLDPADTSAVWVQRGAFADGLHVAGALGLPPRAVATDSAARDYDPDVTVHLGRDYPVLAPFDLP